MNRLYLLLTALLHSTALLLSAGLQAQLPVGREPHHKVIQENPYYRMLEGRIRMNDTTPAHIHAANSVVIFLSHSTFGIQVIGDKPVITTVNPGDVKYAAYGDKPVNHIVWNETPGPLHFYVVELARHPPAGDSCPSLIQPGATLQWRQPAVKAYYLDVNGSFHLDPAPCARLVIAIAGAYHFYPPNSPINLNGAGRRILLEMP